MKNEKSTFEKNELGIEKIQMNILENRQENSPLARATITFKNGMVLHGVNLWPKKDGEGVSVSLPSYKAQKKDHAGNGLLTADGKPAYDYFEYIHPTTSGTRSELNTNVITTYNEGVAKLSQVQSQSQNNCIDTPSIGR